MKSEKAAVESVTAVRLAKQKKKGVLRGSMLDAQCSVPQSVALRNTHLSQVGRFVHVLQAGGVQEGVQLSHALTELSTGG